MHTLRGILKIAGLRQLYESSGGSCFGVTDPSRLRKPFHRPPSPLYTLVYKKSMRRDERAIDITATYNDEMLVYVARDLGITGEMTPEKFRKAGGKEILRNGERIYPPRSK